VTSFRATDMPVDSMPGEVGVFPGVDAADWQVGQSVMCARRMLSFLEDHACTYDSCPCSDGRYCACRRVIGVLNEAYCKHWTWVPGDPIVRFTSNGLEVS